MPAAGVPTPPSVFSSLFTIDDERTGVVYDDPSTNTPASADATPTSPSDDDASDPPRTGGGLTKADFFLETGLLPREYVLEALADADGELLQQTVVRLADWSESYVSHLLGEMEAADQIRRVRFGREKVVYLPHAAPGTNLDR